MAKCDYADTKDCIIRNNDAPDCTDGEVDMEGRHILYWECPHWNEYKKKIDEELKRKE